MVPAGQLHPQVLQGEAKRHRTRVPRFRPQSRRVSCDGGGASGYTLGRASECRFGISASRALAVSARVIYLGAGFEQFH